MKYYAHSKENEPPENWQPIEDHLKGVADLSGRFATEFNAESWAKLAGQAHDIGKGTLAWQAYLRKANQITDEFSKFYIGHVNHSIAGANWLHKYSKEAGKLLSFCISGHHGGLPNWIENASSGLKTRLKEKIPQIQIKLEEPAFEKSLPFAVPDNNRFGFQLQFFVRMLYSCLVDADFLDTEEALNPEKAGWRSQSPPFSKLYKSFFDSLNKILKNADPTNVNFQREIVLRDCLAAAVHKPGLFSLTVPTGGGKTLSSMAFALEHAKRFEKRRIIYVIPFTTIIEQNADVFRKVIQKNAVLEHHFNFLPEDSDWKAKLSTENWDAPIIVTTNVQFFDSFFARKPSKCRKLHNVANSIVIFDEVQAIPVEKLKPCLEVLKELTINYGVTAVLCTATQPAIEYSESFKSGLTNTTEIIQDIADLFKKLKRTKEEYIGLLDDSSLVEKLKNQNQVLCVVNTRKQAFNIFNLLPDDEGNFHLSTLMYPIHRSRILQEIKDRLQNGKKCRVISTQLIEAGVDIDFPVVFRIAAGMDSIAQAAGRCNREGLSKLGKVFIFKMEDGAPPGYFRQTMQSAERLFDKYSQNLLEPECIREYFLNYYWLNQDHMDEGNIVELCNIGSTGDIQFKDISEFQMIKTSTVPIIIALEKRAVSLMHKLDFIEHSGTILRELQQYSVQIYPFQFDELSAWLESPKPGIFVLRSPELYYEKTGLMCAPPDGEAFFA